MSGGSTSRSTTSSRQDVTTENINVDGNDGYTLVGDGNTVSDFGAVSAAFDFAAGVHSEADDTIAGIVADAFDFSRSAIGELSDNSIRTSQILAYQVEQTAAGLREFTLEQTESADDRLADFGSTALLALAALGIAYTLRK